jgi:hypothetical protein
VTRAPLSCAQALAILATDSHPSRDERAQARAHANGCPRCRAIYDTGGDEELLRRFDRSSLQPAAWLRIGLAVIASVQLVLAAPWLFGHNIIPDPDVTVAHLTRDGALGLVIAGLGLLTAWRPRYVHSTLFVGVLVLILQVISGLTDHDATAASGSFELIHLLVLLIVGAMFAVAIDVRRRATPRRRAPTSRLERVR